MKKLKVLISKCLTVAAAAFLLGSCYRSSSKTADVSRDTASDPVHDPAVDVPPDVPPDAPLFTGVEFFIQNISPPGTDVYYFALRGFYRDPIEHSYYMNRVFDGLCAPVMTYQPWCTVDCSIVTGENDCCIYCEPPESFNAVKRLESGRSISIFWDGTTYEMDDDLCDCGCYWRREMMEGRYSFKICAYTDYVCFMEDCMADENGVIERANVGGLPLCLEREFSLPEAGGRVIDFYLGGWD